VSSSFKIALRLSFTCRPCQCRCRIYDNTIESLCRTYGARIF
jgi:hypothetical protein